MKAIKKTKTRSVAILNTFHIKGGRGRVASSRVGMEYNKLKWTVFQGERERTILVTHKLLSLGLFSR